VYNSDVPGQTTFHMSTHERHKTGQIRRDWTRQVPASLLPIIDLLVGRHGNRNFDAIYLTTLSIRRPVACALHHASCT